MVTNSCNYGHTTHELVKLQPQVKCKVNERGNIIVGTTYIFGNCNPQRTSSWTTKQFLLLMNCFKSHQPIINHKYNNQYL